MPSRLDRDRPDRDQERDRLMRQCEDRFRNTFGFERPKTQDGVDSFATILLREGAHARGYVHPAGQHCDGCGGAILTDIVPELRVQATQRDQWGRDATTPKEFGRLMGELHRLLAERRCVHAL